MSLGFARLGETGPAAPRIRPLTGAPGLLGCSQLKISNTADTTTTTKTQTLLLKLVNVKKTP